MIRQDLHTHSVLDDGHATIEEMTLQAIRLGFDSIGFSGHSPLPFLNDWSLTDESLKQYKSDIVHAKHELSGRIRIFAGIEYDIESNVSLDDYDYVIGSLHFISINDSHLSVDESAEITANWLEEYFNGDCNAAMDAYYNQYEYIAANDKINIVGHFDLPSKFDEQHTLFQEFPECARKAIDKLVDANKIFEINTGAISRGYRQTPYPNVNALSYINKVGGKICISSDAHNTDSIGYGFESAISFAKSCGFKCIWNLTINGFEALKI